MSGQQQPEINHYTSPVFSRANKIKRVCWRMTWVMLCSWTPAPMYFWRNIFVRLFGGRIGAGVHIYPTCKIWAPWLLQMDDFSCIGPGVEVYNPGGVKIGRHAILSQDSYLCGATHNYEVESFTYIKKEIIIEAYVWICAKAIVLPGVHCGEGSVLGAASLTSKNMQAWSVYAGNPAKLIKPRINFTNKIQL